MQEAFFGRDLLDRSRQGERGVGPQTPGSNQSGAATSDMKSPTPDFYGPSPHAQLVGVMATSKKQGTLREFYFYLLVIMWFFFVIAPSSH